MIYGFISSLDDETTKVFFKSKKIRGNNIYNVGSLGELTSVLQSGDVVYAKKYPDCCRYKNGTFRITNMEKFGKEALSGVPLNKETGAYMIVTDVPINKDNIAFPSVSNASSYQAYHVSGGELLSGGTEMTIRPLEGVIKDKDIVIDEKGITGKDADTGIEFSVQKLEE